MIPIDYILLDKQFGALKRRNAIRDIIPRPKKDYDLLLGLENLLSRMLREHRAEININKNHENTRRFRPSSVKNPERPFKKSTGTAI